MYRAVTRKVQVTVTPRFLAERSSPGNGYFFWAYTIAITNTGTTMNGYEKVAISCL